MRLLSRRWSLFPDFRGSSSSLMFLNLMTGRAGGGGGGGGVGVAAGGSSTGDGRHAITW